MATKMINVTAQITGTNNIFEVPTAMVTSTAAVGYNGQVYPPGINIAGFPTNKKVELDFVPTYDADSDLNSKLMIIYEEYLDLNEDIVGTATPPGLP